MLKEILSGKKLWSTTSFPTDAYKMSMALGGRPEETEVFYLSYRSNKAMNMPRDLEEVVYECIPNPTNLEDDVDWLRSHGFPVTSSILRTATNFRGLDILYAAPKGELVCPREPLLTLRGPQALLSWLEPLLIGRVSYQMQVADAADKACMSGEWDLFIKKIGRVTCERQKELTLEACAFLGEEDVEYIKDFITVDEEGYYQEVQDNARKLLATGVELSRFFEVGLRAATCMEQHIIALKALKDMGFTATSNVYGAYVLGMKPVGTLGHEGIMRWGGNDELAFRKHAEVLPAITMLLDTNDTLKVGMPTALKLMEEYPHRKNDGVRPDSGDLAEQFKVFVQEIRKRKISPRTWIFEDGLDDKGVSRYEELRKSLDYPAEKTLFGLGGFFIDRPEFTQFRRGNLSMVYKLSWTESYGPTMKFGNEEESLDSGKQSIPGIPILAVCDYDNYQVSGLRASTDVMVCQYECLPEGWRVYSKGDSNKRKWARPRPEVDTITKSLIDDCFASKQAIIDSYLK